MGEDGSLLEMKQNFKIIFCLGIVFLSSFLVLGLFLEAYSQGILTSQKNITKRRWPHTPPRQTIRNTLGKNGPWNQR